MPQKNKSSQQLKSLYFIALVNAAIWAIGMIALVFILQNGGSPKGMYVILASGTAVAIQIIALVSKMKRT